MSADIKERGYNPMWMNSVFARIIADMHGYILCGVKTTAL